MAVFSAYLVSAAPTFQDVCNYIDRVAIGSSDMLDVVSQDPLQQLGLGKLMERACAPFPPDAVVVAAAPDVSLFFLLALSFPAAAAWADTIGALSAPSSSAGAPPPPPSLLSCPVALRGACATTRGDK